jgi:hypothetical protein
VVAGPELVDPRVEEDLIIVPPHGGADGAVHGGGPAGVFQVDAHRPDMGERAHQVADTGRLVVVAVL